MYILAQTIPQSVPAAPPAASPPIFPSLDTLFWFTVFFIFLVAILSALLRRLAKDKALKLFHEYHVSFFAERRTTLWGDCLVSSQGIELLFDQAFKTRRALVKSSALIYEDEPMVCLTRSIHGLNEQELKDRAAQIHHTFKPGPLRRSKRWFHNMLNTMRDAITKTVTLVIGRMTPAGAMGAVAVPPTGDINALTGNVVGLIANAYEPLLERYIGQPVVVEIVISPSVPLPPGVPVPAIPPPPPPPLAGGLPLTAEFPGYLVDYTQKYIAVFNVDHTPVESYEIVLEPGKPPVPDLADLKITISDQDTIIRCEGKDAFVLRKISSNGQDADLGIAMIPGTAVVLAAMIGPTTMSVERTRHIDLIVPRTRARVRYGSMPVRDASAQRRNWLGTAPVLESRELLNSLRENVYSVGQSIRSGLRRRSGEAGDSAEHPGETFERREDK